MSERVIIIIHYCQYLFLNRAEMMVNEAEGTFWERSFGDEDEVLWYRFEHAFLTDYDTQISCESMISLHYQECNYTCAN